MESAANGRLLDGAVIALLLAASVLIQFGAVSRPLASGDQPVAILFAPWVSADIAMQRVATTGARIVGLGALPFIVIAEPDGADFSARAAEVGALFIIDSAAVRACLTYEGVS
jgi:hypothetical protein